MNQVLVYAIDSLDARILDDHLDHMPNFQRLLDENGRFELEVVYPPDSPTCWATIFTGLDPAKHGVFHFVDPLSRVGQLVAEEIDNTTVAGRSLFDVASAAGKRVCVLNPLLGYPPWKLNGVFVGRATTSTDVLTEPPGLFNGHVPDIHSLKGVPGREANFEAWVDRAEELARNEMALALDMLEREPWNLVWTYSSVLDSVQHYFWNYFDEADPSYPGPSEYQDLLSRFMGLHDELLGKLREAAPEATVLVVSDHGHMRRPLRTVNLNEALRQRGLLSLKGAGASTAAGIQTKVRRRIIKTVVDHKLGNVALKAMKLAPWGKKLFLNPVSIDWTRTKAHISDMSGIKAYVYGGVVVRRENLADGEYEAVRDEVIETFRALEHPETGEPILQEVHKREALYAGPHLERYPDLVFELHEEFGASWEVGDGLFGEAAASNIVPGSHRPGASAVFAAGGKLPAEPARRSMGLADVCPTVLDLLGVAPPEGIDGRSILQG